MSFRSREPSSFASISSSETLIPPTKKTLWETRIPSPKKENNWVTSPRSHVSLLPEYIGAVPILPLKGVAAFPKTLDRALRPLSCATNGRMQPTNERPLKLSDKTRLPRPVYKESELVAARAHELMEDMNVALQIIIKNSPPKPQAQSPFSSRLPLDDASFACEYGIEQYREGFRRRSMQSKRSPMKLAVDELKKELKDELRSEIKMELKAEIEVELKEEIKEEIYGELAGEFSKEHQDLQQLIDSEDGKTVQGEEPTSIQDMVKGLRDDMSVSDAAEEDSEVEEPLDPTDPALAFFLNFRNPKRESLETGCPESRGWGSSSSCYSQ